MTLLEKIKILEDGRSEVAKEAMEYLKNADIDPVLKDMLYNPFIESFFSNNIDFNILKQRLAYLDFQIKKYKEYKLCTNTSQQLTK